MAQNCSIGPLLWIHGTPKNTYLLRQLDLVSYSGFVGCNVTFSTFWRQSSQPLSWLVPNTQPSQPITLQILTKLNTTITNNNTKQPIITHLRTAFTDLDLYRTKWALAFVLVSFFYTFYFWLRVLDKADHIRLLNPRNSSIVLCIVTKQENY